MGSNLHCSATNCAFNKTDTFRDKDNFNMTNYHGDTGLTSTQNISCSANKCTYNIYGACNASHVDINFENSSCETFVAK